MIVNYNCKTFIVQAIADIEPKPGSAYLLYIYVYCDLYELIMQHEDQENINQLIGDQDG
jgi:hypothetical protein